MGDPNQKQDEISEGRKFLYYLGGVIIVIGFLSFFSVFISGAMHFGDFRNFEARGQSMAFRGFGGMFLIIVGAVIRGIGSMGLAGSGVVLDPAQARQDVKPWTKMAGGMVNDAVNEIEVVKDVVENLGEHHDEAVREVVKVRCPKCKALNDEDANFCSQCGQAMK
ncbi:zinc ribbon domain-containing protein [bacterium]|nr:zinc ribbon domain-containing protein [bacterium]